MSQKETLDDIEIKRIIKFLFMYHIPALGSDVQSVMLTRDLEMKARNIVINPSLTSL